MPIRSACTTRESRILHEEEGFDASFPSRSGDACCLALTVAACGGSSNSADSSSSADTSAPASGSGDAAGILSAIDTKASTGPQKLKLDVTVDIKGTPANQQLALFTKQPIHLGLDGVIDSTGKSADVNVSVTLGKSPLEAEIRTGGGKSWIQIDGKWYDLPANVALVDDRLSRCRPASRRAISTRARFSPRSGIPRSCWTMPRFRATRSKVSIRTKCRAMSTSRALRPLPQISRRAWATARQPLRRRPRSTRP